MRHKEDFRTLVTMLVFVLLQAGMIVYWADASLLLRVFFFIFNSWMILIVTMINHNHQHLSVFHSPVLNQCLNFVISGFILAPASRLHAVHHYNHHRHYQGHEDWTHYSLVPNDVKGLKRGLLYVWRAGLKMSRNRKTLQIPDALKRSMNMERAFVFVYSVLLIWFSYKAYFFFMLPSMIVGLSLLLLFNLADHDGCELESDFAHSRNFLSSWDNWISFNNGYHTAHHLRPGMHWSLYPEYHDQEVQPKLDHDLVVRKSIFHYIATRYGL